MKTRFSTVDIAAIVSELQKYVGMRVNQVYDVDSKTYLFKLNAPQDQKVTLLLESGIRIHTTDFEWPKGSYPSGFSMKLRKHIKNKRLEKITQLGIDRIIDLQFGINEAAYHVILELYDRGNLVLTDSEYLILNILRPRTDNAEDVKFVVRETYPVGSARYASEEDLVAVVGEALSIAKPGDNLRKILLGAIPYGPALLNHVLLGQQFTMNTCIGKGFDPIKDTPRLMSCIREAQSIVSELSSGSGKGYVIQEEKTSPLNQEKVRSNVEFHPYLFRQHISSIFTTYPSFDKAVDHFFSTMESQKLDSKVLQKEKEALKKLENVKKDHQKRLENLLKEQEENVKKAGLIEMNIELVDKAILIIRSAIANQISWSDINELIQEAQAEGDPVAKCIKKLKLEINHITVLLSNPFDAAYEDKNDAKPQLVDIDLDLSAYGNARKYYDRKRQHAKKEQKTVEASEKAFKNAEKRTKETLKEASVISTIVKARKPMWFEKFIWFISSENYLIIAGRDIPQNELIVKRYMKPGDIYVHADIHGASSVVIKNYSKGEVPPKTLNEAGTLSICYSTAWEAKVLTSAWWVYHHQVSKTAPTGEYLTAGSFMIRGKKNYLLPSHLILGFGFLFKLGDDSLERHKDERRIRCDTENSSVTEELDEIIDVKEEEDDDNEENGSDDGSKASKEPKPVDEEYSSSDEADSVPCSGQASFPDTEVQLDVLKEKDKMLIRRQFMENEEDEDTTLIIAPRRTPKIQQNSSRNARPNANNVAAMSAKSDQLQPKKIRKGKLKKIKEKYKDQDEEERALRMKILGSLGEPKGDKRKKKKQSKTNEQKPERKTQQQKTEAAKESDDVQEKSVGDAEPGDRKPPPVSRVSDSEEDEEETNEARISEEVNLLNSLTGCPFADDTLLYAVPVCAPYSAMQNYKYKVKMMPGTGRRGKAAKAALNIFLHDKNAAQREKDCLKSVKDQDISRNFPSGKIKLAYSTAKRK